MILHQGAVDIATAKCLSGNNCAIFVGQPILAASRLSAGLGALESAPAGRIAWQDCLPHFEPVRILAVVQKQPG